MDVDATAATRDDLAAIAVLAEEAVEELRPLRGGDMWYRREARAGDPRDAIAPLIGAEGHTVVVGRIDGTVVGYAVASAQLLRDGSTVADLTDIYVMPGARGVGVGEALMDAVVGWATTEGCTGIDSVALPGDRGTKNFFESFGLVARALRVHRRLDTP